MNTAHMIYDATAKQIAGLELEREAHLQQIRALVAERDLLREQVETFTVKLTHARQTADMWRRAYHGDGVAPE